MQQILLPKQLSAFLARFRKTDKTPTTSDSIRVRRTEEPQTPVASERTVEDISHQPAGSPPISSVDSADTEGALSALVKRYEIGSGENKVNVCIYKEPAAHKL
jgi:hypothetical protein